MDHPPYDNADETHTEESAINVAFVKSIGGIMKIVEMVISILTFIFVAVATLWSSHASGGWMNFVAAITLVATALFFIFNLFNIIRRLKGPWVIIEFTTLVLSAFLWFVAFLVAATHTYINVGWIVVTAISSLVAMAIYIAELALRFRVQKHGNVLRITMTSVTSTALTKDIPPYTGGAPRSGMPIMTAPQHQAPPYPEAPGHGGYPPAGGYPAGGGHAEQGFVVP